MRLSVSSYKNLWSFVTVPTTLFLIVAGLFGVIYCFTVPPLFANDEIVHFPRAYYLQEGHLSADRLGEYGYGGYVPEQIKQFNDAYREQVQSDHVDEAKLQEIKGRYAHETVKSDDHEPLSFTSATLSAGWDYLPPAIGIFVSRVLNLPLNWYVYLGRLSTLAVWMLLTYFAIKFMPFGKQFLLVVALLPVSVMQGTTIGMDGLVNGLSWLITAMAFAILVKKLQITPKLLALIAFLSLYLATTKQGYAPIAALPLIISARFFPFDLKRVWAWRLAFGGALLLFSLWYLGATAPIAEVIHHVQRPGLFVDEGAQLHYIFQHPLQFLGMIFIQPFTIWSASIYASMVGVLTNRLLWLPIPLILLLFAVLFITSLHKERLQVNRRDRLYVLFSSIGAFLATFILINLALYLSFTQVAYDHVEGLQGRYFLALLPLMGVILHTAMPKLFLKISDSLMDLITYPIIVTGLVFATTIIH